MKTDIIRESCGSLFLIRQGLKQHIGTCMVQKEWFMFHTLSVLKKIIPKEIETLHRRYKLLKVIQLIQPVGRRLLANKLSIGEKMVRSDTDYFREEGYISVTSGGMILTEDGIELLETLKEIMKDFEGIREIEDKLKRIIGCKEILVV